MSQFNQDDPQLRIIRELAKIKADIRRSDSVQSPYDVANENTPDQITINPNDYDPGNYSVLRLSTDAARNITGISGGVKGRSLHIINVGTFTITLIYNSALSVAANRFYISTASHYALATNKIVDLYYDSTIAMWRIIAPGSS